MVVVDRRVAGEARRFGVSGLLYRSDLLMFDRETGSLWSQISAEAVTGASEGLRLALLRAGMHRLDAWRRAHPRGTVLSRDTGHTRRYGATPYAGYATSEELYFPAPRDPRFHPRWRLARLVVRPLPFFFDVGSGGIVVKGQTHA